MSQLIPIANGTIAGQATQTVNARDLHAYLGVAKDFSDWIKVQIKRTQLDENKDFLVVPQKGENLQGGRPALEYHLTIEAGKHIAMLAGTAKGKEVREYFIECERRALPPAAALTPGEMILAMAQQYLAHERRIAQTENKVLMLEGKLAEKERHMTVLEFSISNGLPTDMPSVRSLGFRASAMSRQMGVAITTKHQDTPGFRGNVNAYHPDVLFAVLDQMFGAQRLHAVGSAA